MTAAWWSKEASPAERAAAVESLAAPLAWPQLVTPTRDAAYNELVARIAGYTPEWTNRRQDDAGIALAHLFSEQLEPVLQRLNVLPQNAFIEFLTAAGITPLPATAADALLQFTVSASATQSIYAPAGFQVAAGSVIFETNADLYAAPGTLAELYAVESGLYRAIDPTPDVTPFQPFGRSPKPGLAFLIGISATPDTLIGPQISLAFEVQGPAGLPAPVSTGGVVPLPAPLAPLVQWDVLDGATYQDTKVLLDETQALTQSGIVTLQLPPTWQVGIPAGSPDTQKLFWLRVQILSGDYSQAPVMLAVRLNAVRATAVQTFRNEVLTPVPGGTGGRSIMEVSQTPVLPYSMQLQVDDTADISFTAEAGAGANAVSTWQEVDDLYEWGPDDHVYQLDSASGQVTFGDGTHGMALPPGFRNVVALAYQVGGGSAGAVAAGAVSSPVNSVPFLSSVQNPAPATGGSDPETQQDALLRGPQQLRAQGRAVAAADYEILALNAPGARVARAGAVPGFHPSFAGTPIPGVVCVFVVPPESGSSPPIPTADTLRAVSIYLSSLAPVGTEVVAAAPDYRNVRVETSVVVDPAADRGATIQEVITEITKYLDPIGGGSDGNGWPFGGTLGNTALVRTILTNVPAVQAVPSLLFVVDGVRGALCADFPLPANSLVWPETPIVLGLGPEEEP